VDYFTLGILPFRRAQGVQVGNGNTQYNNFSGASRQGTAMKITNSSRITIIDFTSTNYEHAIDADSCEDLKIEGLKAL
jgi:hypothetical protein